MRTILTNSAIIYRSTGIRHLTALPLPQHLPMPSSLSGLSAQLRDRLRRATRHSAFGKRCRLVEATTAS